MITPHKLIAKYPAPWRIDDDAVCLPLFEAHAIAAEAVVVTVYVNPILHIELGYKGQRIGNLTPATPDTLVSVIAEKIAYVIACAPGAIKFDKVPPWARAATAQALEPHLVRLQDAQTHLEWSAP